MFDRTRTVYGSCLNYTVVAGATIAAEGMALSLVDDGAGGTAVRPCTAAAEKFIGFSRSDNIRVATEVVVESITVPGGGGAVNLSFGNIVVGSSNAFNVTGAVALTLVGGAPAAGEYQINTTNGIITFNAAEAADVVTVTYRRTLTLEQIQMKYQSSLPNNIAMDWLGYMDVMGGEGNMYTDQYDTAFMNTYTPTTALRLGAGGLVTTQGAGTVIGYVLAQPGATNPYLGIKYAATI